MSDPDYLELEQEFGEVMSMLREGRLDPPGERPSIGVWKSIADGLDGEVALGHIEAEEDKRPQTNVVSLDSRREKGKRIALMVGVAAAFILVAVPLTLALGAQDGSQQVELAALDGFTGAGEAELEGRSLTLALDDLPPLEDGATYDVWLLDLEGDELEDLRWIGFAEAGEVFEVPANVDLAEFDVVDVSIEPDDGDASHSGNSVLQGQLEQT